MPESGGLRGGHLPLARGHRGSRIAGNSRGRCFWVSAESCGANHTGVGAEEQAVTPDEFQEATERQRAAISASGEAPAERGGEREEDD
jgi:heme/copper-type cytochrome/quinol oxidase subunit 2